MRHCSVQVRGLLTREELDRYNALMDVGHYLETAERYDLVQTVQKVERQRDDDQANEQGQGQLVHPVSLLRRGR